MKHTDEIKNEIRAFFEQNEDTFNEVIEELDNWSGYLGDDRYYNMSDFDELHTGLSPMEVLQRTFYGGDDDTKDEQGRRGEFNPNREWFYYNGYGNLCSTDYKDYSAHLDDYFIEAVIDNRSHLWIDDNDLNALLDQYEQAEAEENEAEAV